MTDRTDVQLAWEDRVLTRAVAQVEARSELEARVSAAEMRRGTYAPRRTSAAFQAYCDAVQARAKWQRAHGPGPVSDAAAVELEALTSAVENAAQRHDVMLARRKAILDRPPN